jgi:hypothetical protein
MIVEAFLGLLFGLFSFVGDLMPEMEVPAFVGSIAGLVGTITGAMAPLGMWIPFGAAGTATTAVLVAIGVAVAVKIVRIVLSLFTGGGGSAA